MKYIFTLATIMVATACFDSEKEEDTASEENNEEQGFAPSEGTWEVSPPDFEGDCLMGDGGSDTGDVGDEDPEEDDEPGLVQISVEGDALSLEIIEDDGENILVSCTLSDMDFSCEPVSIEEGFEGADAALVQEMNLSGTFSSATEFSGVLSMDLSCSGADCDAFGGNLGLPCSMSGPFSAEFAE